MLVGPGTLLIVGLIGGIGAAATYTSYALSRHPPAASEKLTPVVGDILKLGLGMENVPEDIVAIYHLAAIHRLGNDPDGSIWETNVEGTKNVIKLCLNFNIPRLYFVSSAYTQGRNVYERSKALCETMVKESGVPKVTIFKPSVIMGTAEHFYPGHFSQFVSLLIKVHQRAEIVRRKIEGTLRLPVIEPVFHMKANPKGVLNIIPLSEVVDAMVHIDKPGTYWLTHPNPPTLEQLVEWIGEYIMVRIVITDNFKPTPVEMMFQKLSTAFNPYLWGDDFPSHLKGCPPITKEFIQDTIKRTLQG